MRGVASGVFNGTCNINAAARLAPVVRIATLIMLSGIGLYVGKNCSAETLETVIDICGCIIDSTTPVSHKMDIDSLVIMRAAYVQLISCGDGVGVFSHFGFPFGSVLTSYASHYMTVNSGIKSLQQ